MKTKITRSKDVLALTLAITSGEEGDIVYPSGDLAVSKAPANSRNVLGILAYKDKEGDGTVETNFSREMEVEFDGAVAPGDYVKIGANNPSGEQCYKKWVSGTDAESLRIGLCIKGGADESVGIIVM